MKKIGNFNVLKLVQMAMLAAVSLVLVYLIHFPIFPAAPFLEYDPADIPIIIGTFMFGPGGGLILTAVVCIIQGMTVSSSSGIIGIFMHFVATGGYVLISGLIYRRDRNLKSAFLAMLAGVAVMCASMALWNVIFIPIFMGAPRQVVIDMLLPVIFPFNAIKAGLNSMVAFMLFKSLNASIHILKRQGI